MSEKISAIETIINAVNHKITSYMVGSGMVGVSAVSQHSESRLRTLNEIPVYELFEHPMSLGSLFGVIGTLYIFFQVGKDVFSFCAKRRAAKRRSMKRRAEDK